MSMNVTPSSTARRAVATASLRSGQFGAPVSRIAPKPSRWTGRSPPTVMDMMFASVSMCSTLCGATLKDKRHFLNPIA